MMEKKELTDEIIVLEWEAFQNVQNIGGRASCQDDAATFAIMRNSQLCMWSEAMLESYREDLKQAREKEENLLSEKYAYMMAYTSPEEYAEIRDLLPVVSETKRELAGRIVDVSLDWQRECMGLYPHVLKNGRPLRSTEDSEYQTSFETYLRCELYTYSENTLRLYDERVREARKEQCNLLLNSYSQMVRDYGYSSLDEAESHMKAVS